MRGPARTRRRGPAYSRGRSGEPRPQPIGLLWTSRAIDTPEANKQLESAWNPLCPRLGCWEQGVPVIVLYVAAFRLLPSASDARWSRSRRGEQAALPASSPAVPDTRARRLCLSLPSHPSSDSGSGSRPSIPLIPLDHQGSERLHTPRPALRGSRHNKCKSARTPLSLHLRGVITG